MNAPVDEEDDPLLPYAARGPPANCCGDAIGR